MNVKVILPLLFLSTVHLLGLGQTTLPILRTNTEQISIIDGDVHRKGYWYVDPNLEIDIYVANKLNKPKQVSFYSSIDTLTFQLDAHESYDFIVLHNGKDSCFTRLQSGIQFERTDKIVLTSDTLPFLLTKDNNILIQTVMNQTDTLNMMFHTALSSVSITEEAAKKMRSISLDQSSVGNSWGGSGTSRYSTNNSFQVGDFTFENQTIWENKNSGPQSDGKFGPYIFGEKVLELDFENNRLIIHSTLPKIDDSYRKTSLIFDQDHMYLNLELLLDGDTLKHKALIHSGYASNLLLDGDFSAKHNLSKRLALESSIELKDSYDNSVFTQSAKIKQVRILNANFDSLLVNFFEGTIGNETKSVVGSNVLKRFNLIFDLQTATLFYKPNYLMEQG